jgi:transposase
MPKPYDLSHPLIALEPDCTMVVVVEMSQSSWLVAAVVPGLARAPLKKIDTDEHQLLRLIERWKAEAAKADRTITRTVLAYEAGRDGFWLARWLIARGVETYVIHSSSVAVSREHRRAKTDRLDTEMLKRVLLGWLRGERGHCRMVQIPSVEEEDARRPGRERETLVRERTRIANRLRAASIRLGIRRFNPVSAKALEQLPALRTADGNPVPPHWREEMRRDLQRLALIKTQIREIEAAREERLQAAPTDRPHALVCLLAKIRGIGVETAALLVHEVLVRNLRDRRAVARYAGLTGSPDESGSRRRDKGLAKSGNARLRKGMIQLAWRWLMFQPESALAQWYRERTQNAAGLRKTMIAALARKLLVELWRFAATGELPTGATFRVA